MGFITAILNNSWKAGGSVLPELLVKYYSDGPRASRGKTNVVVEWLTLLLRTGEVQGSNLGRRPAVLAENLVGFLGPPRQNAGIEL
jgi:hypothetical protein